MSQASQVYQKPLLEFKSSTLSVPVLLPRTNKLDVVRSLVTEKIKQAPDFFKHSPVIVDLGEVPSEALDLSEWVTLIRTLQLLPIGVRNANAEQERQALALHLPILSDHHTRDTDSEPKSLSAAPAIAQPEDIVIESEQKIPETLTITQPVRSGQRIYTEGDLIVLAQVSAGAEIIAGGNVHVYHGLRGRVLAGVPDNQQARIFCYHLQAELISIAGTYKVSEDIDFPDKSEPVQVYLKGSTLVIEPLSTQL
ncbi:MAG: septum site-determining protein MinC [Methylococcales bacterium]|nr:septum site-determining protein MinC [Methylococcales bacterium]